MRHTFIIAAAIAAIGPTVRAQQGPAYPQPGSDRGPAFPYSVSPGAANQTNWFQPQTQYTEPNGPNARWNHRPRWGSHARWHR
jgi:hypothetical protein